MLLVLVLVLVQRLGLAEEALIDATEELPGPRHHCASHHHTRQPVAPHGTHEPRVPAAAPIAATVAAAAAAAAANRKQTSRQAEGVRGAVEAVDTTVEREAQGWKVSGQAVHQARPQRGHLCARERGGRGEGSTHDACYNS